MKTANYSDRAPQARKVLTVKNAAPKAETRKTSGPPPPPPAPPSVTK